MDRTIRILIPDAISGKSKLVERSITEFKRSLESHGIPTEVYTTDIPAYYVNQGDSIMGVPLAAKSFPYSVTCTIAGTNKPMTAQISLKMPLPCWNKLEKTDAWRCLLEAAASVSQEEEKRQEETRIEATGAIPLVKGKQIENVLWYHIDPLRATICFEDENGKKQTKKFNIMEVELSGWQSEQ